MKPAEYVKILDKIQKEHLCVNITENNKRKIKYVTSNYDSRDNTIYRVTFREWFSTEEISFPNVNHSFDGPSGVDDMYEEIIKWLDEEFEESED